MSIFWIIVATFLLAQIGCIVDMLMRGETIPTTFLGGGRATRTRRSDSKLVFYFEVLMFVIIFMVIDAFLLLATLMSLLG